MTAAEFLRRFPEFSSAGPQLITAKLTEAAAMLSVEAFPDARHDLAIGYQAAQLLWTSPFGVGMRLDSAGEELTSPYEGQLERLRLGFVSRVIVL